MRRSALPIFHGETPRILRALAAYKRSSSRGPLASAPMTSAHRRGQGPRTGALSRMTDLKTPRRTRARASIDHDPKGQRSGGQVRHLRMVGLCLVAVFAMSAVAATSASAALPEFGQCFEKAGTGKYSNSVCTTKAKPLGTGNFEFRKGPEIAKKHFVGNAGTGVLEAKYIGCYTKNEFGEPVPDEKYGRKGLPCPGGDEENVVFEKPLKIECESESNTGEFTGTKEVKSVTVVFHGCKLEGTAPCSNTSTEGEIQVNTLKGKLGWINKKATPREVGLLLEPAVKKGEFAKFGCLGGQIVTVVGMGNANEGCAYPQKACGGDGLISPIGPVNTTTSALTQTFTINEATQENVPNKFEGAAPRKSLESYFDGSESPNSTTQWSKAGETTTNVAVSEVPGEIKAN